MSRQDPSPPMAARLACPTRLRGLSGISEIIYGASFALPALVAVISLIGGGPTAAHQLTAVQFTQDRG